MSTTLLSDEQREVLQEVTNIGMGQAGSSIAKILNGFVHLSIPQIFILRPSEISPMITKIANGNSLSAVSQAFFGQIRGEAIVIYEQQSCNNLAQSMGYDSIGDGVNEYELLLDVTNILVGACLGGIAGQLKTEIGFSPPSVVAEHVPPEKIISTDELATAFALFLEVNFRLEQRSFACNLIVLMPEAEIRLIGKALDRFLENL